VTPLRAALLALAATPAVAEDPTYRDDRSDPAAIVRSYYNAVARHEYARAWSYFGDDKPVPAYDAFVAGYAGTASVEIDLGEVTTEGAAGSLYGSVPLALAATAPDGTVEVFAGCYTTRQLEIVSGSLAPAKAPLADAVPSDCPAP
jgi:hypothetical protein